MTHERAPAIAGRPVRQTSQPGPRPVGTVPPAAVLQALARRYHVSPRQARRYVDAAQQHPQGLPVPAPKVVFTVKLPVGVVRRVRTLARATGENLSALVTRALEDLLDRVRQGPRGGT